MNDETQNNHREDVPSSEKSSRSSSATLRCTTGGLYLS